MNENKISEINSVHTKLRNFFVSTDIRALVTLPPIVSFGGFFLLFFLLENLTNGTTPQAFIEIGLGIACLIECIAGVAMVIKQEMPRPLGNKITGKYALVSGWTIVLLFGLSG